MTITLRIRQCSIIMTGMILLLFSWAPLANGMADANDHWAEDEIRYAVEEGWMSGYSKAEFGVNEPLSRAEMAVVLSRILSISPGNVSFMDVSPNHWAAASISAVAEEGLINGYPDQSFSPDGHISREELAAIMVRSFSLKEGEDQLTFSDVSSDRWSYEAINTLTSNGMIAGYPDGTFQPAQSVTRAELAVILKRIIDLDGMRQSLSLGMTQDEVVAVFGEEYAVVVPGAYAQPGPIWRYDLGVSSDYQFESYNDSVDLDGLRDRDLDYQVFLSWEADGTLMNYTIYYANDGIYEYRVNDSGESETNKIRSN